MKRTTLQNAMAVGVLAIASGFAVQASASPLFTFMESAGFQSSGSPGTAVPAGVTYSGALSNPGALEAPNIGNTLNSVMNWRDPPNPGANQNISHLLISNPVGQQAFPTSASPFQTFGPAQVITTLSHQNNVINSPFSWTGQDIWGRFQVWDHGVNVLDNTEAITIDFTETLNALDPITNTCTGGNPFNPPGAACPDYFTFTVAGLGDLEFQALDGVWWTVRFDLDITNCINCAFDPVTGRVFTQETQISFLNITASLRCEPFKGSPPNPNDPQSPLECDPPSVPEPSILTLIGLGLLGLGFTGWRRQKGSMV